MRKAVTGSPALLRWGAALTIGLAVLPAQATHRWGTAHWARTSTLGIRLGDNVGTAWDTYLRTAAADWSKATQLDTLTSVGQSAPSTCAAVYGNVQVCNAPYGSTGWLGIGQVWTTSDGHIVQGTVKLNDTYFAQARYNTPSWRRLVTCQEVGHTLGLDHQDVNTANANLGSCMDYTNDPSGTAGTNGTLNNEHPNKHDYDELSIIYNHTDSTQLASTKVTSSTAAERAVPPQRQAAALKRQIGIDRSEWGRSIAADAKGRPRIFVRDLGDGVELTTFVTWAGDAPPGAEH